MAKIKLEIILNENGVTFLNFWNWYNGDDVVTEIVDGKIIDDNGHGKEITLQEFIDRVREKNKVIDTAMTKKGRD